MTVLALVREEPQPAVLAVAGSLAALTQSGVRTVVVPASENAAAPLPAELNDAATSIVVLERDALAPARWERVVRESTRPVVVVPTDLAGERSVSRVLVPLDGTPEAADAVAGTLALFARGGVDLVVLHVFDESTVPRFWDQAAHTGRAWAEEFLARHCPQPGTRLELRSGRPGEHVLDVAAAEDVDLVTLGWSRQLSPGRARTVRRTVAGAHVPVLLIPVAGAD